MLYVLLSRHRLQPTSSSSSAPPPPFIRYLKPSSSTFYEASISSRTGRQGAELSEPPTRNTRTFVHYKAIYRHSDVVTVAAFDSEKFGAHKFPVQCGVLAYFHPFQIASLHQHSLSHQLLGVRQPFYTKKRYGWRRHLQPWRPRQQSRPDPIISSDSFFVVEHPRMTMRKKIKTCQPAAHCPLSIGLI